MSYDMLQTLIGLALYLWFPLCTIFFIYLICRVRRKVLKRCNEKGGSVISMCFIYSLPSLFIYIIIIIPVFYINHLGSQYDVCMNIVRVNKITTVDNEFLQERCGTFDLPELIQKSKAEVKVDN
ncbi:hypothetical protein A9G13_08585 [Gilliamella sp. wkB178]|uniref:hypothetical protein n=1 Tax=Gilliamella sp. wkB178 TaxID=3120259 RepID=UPI00080E4B01|nr:hypothetical protein [Gilliamella apicola]OCG07032.1 hypothetical protein A9G13_08585 [Gilliamella apicola]